MKINEAIQDWGEHWTNSNGKIFKIMKCYFFEMDIPNYLNIASIGKLRKNNLEIGQIILHLCVYTYLLDFQTFLWSYSSMQK